LPLCSWVNLSEGSKPRIDQSTVSITNAATSYQHFITSQPLGKALFDNYGHNCLLEKCRKKLKKCLWFTVEITKTKSANALCDGGFKIGVTNKSPTETVPQGAHIMSSYVLCGQEAKERLDDQSRYEVNTKEFKSLKTGDCVRVYVKRDKSVCFAIKKKKGEWKNIKLKQDLVLTPSSESESFEQLWGCVTLGNSIVEVKLSDVSGHRVVGEEGRYNVDKSVFDASNFEERNAQVERWLRGSIQLRSRPEFPGDAYRTIHTLSAGDTFKFTETRELVHLISLVKTGHDGPKEDKVK
jgi:hypothetical protein